MEITTSLLTEEIFRISEIMLQTNNGFKINKTKCNLYVLFTSIIIRSLSFTLFSSSICFL